MSKTKRAEHVFNYPIIKHRTPKNTTTNNTNIHEHTHKISTHHTRHNTNTIIKTYKRNRINYTIKLESQYNETRTDWLGLTNGYDQVKTQIRGHTIYYSITRSKMGCLL